MKSSIVCGLAIMLSMATFAVAEPSASQEPSASKESSASKEPSASKELSASKESSTSKQSSAGEVAYGACASCHGAAGQGNAALNGPALAGQSEAYLVRQLQHFKQGIRGSDPRDVYGQQMLAMVTTLGDEEAISNVASHLASLSIKKPLAQGTESLALDLRNGANQYNGYCGACHGAKAEGNEALNAPQLAQLDAAYLKRQMQNFQQGVRGAHPKDRYGKQMAMMANTLANEKDLDDVIGFITGVAITKR
ncbi:MAG: cytochrome c [Pseudomonadales bacterium]